MDVQFRFCDNCEEPLKKSEKAGRLYLEGVIKPNEPSSRQILDKPCLCETCSSIAHEALKRRQPRQPGKATEDGEIRHDSTTACPDHWPE